MPSWTVQTLILKTRCCNLKRVQAPGRDRWGLWQPPKWKPSWLSIGSLTLCRDLDPTWPGLLIFRGTKEYYWLLIFFFLWNFWFSLWAVGELSAAGGEHWTVCEDRARSSGTAQAVEKMAPVNEQQGQWTLHSRPWSGSNGLRGSDTRDTDLSP